VTGQSQSVRELQKSLRPLQRLDRKLLIDADDDRILGRAMYSETTSAALTTNLGSLLSHQDLRPPRSTFCARRKRQTYWTSTSPSAQPATVPSSVHNPRVGIHPTALGCAYIFVSAVYFLSAPLARLIETRKPLLCIAHAPLRCRTGRASDDRPIARLAMPPALLSRRQRGNRPKQLREIDLFERGACCD
jgi:hypothetical protein